MASYKNLKEELDALEIRVKRALRVLIGESKTQSKHVDSKALKVNVFDYQELVIINDELTFIGENGLHYSLYAECSLEDLIDLLTNLN